ncbi:dipeptide/oligopeptide/nickel ABC transporter permease/ATP-binding protein [Goodfellowiella coeruleoviolacea]|uniref:Oligopeptide/dipeptide ABC transporter, ATP-binding protein, C-terminal domain-containing protein n=1 Tax=Goodfellowiella coeruleoviolacea TaxID=334858 RepID=A0AAE3G9Q7_9PSEU|nr:dipeptide/oligopeptide/nickel ABC transporter permease/ATP-binding protein [Goodfellowiella coeruleoviolacea]MCP2163479.1 oligopeptide/dipeptide ABC transporter, ATP-binding protein, C-terminal domain-containing protein [Goodfellowiella coeruleoviolacea]
MAVPTTELAATAPQPAPVSPGRRRRLRFAANPKAATGLVILGGFVLLAIIGPWIAPHDPSLRGTDLLQPPSAAHWFGTTHLGQDIFSQVLAGTRSVVVVGFVAGIVSTALSILVGVTSGYLSGAGGESLSALSNVFLVIPALPLIVIIASALPGTDNLTIALVIGLTSWAWGARVLRAQTLSLRRRDYVQAARATGESTWRIILFEIMPNLAAVIASGFISTVIFAVTSEITLAFIGVGDTSTWNWGTILFWAQSQQALAQGAWWWFVPAGLAIALLGTALSLVNFGIDELVSPRLRGNGGTTARTEDGHRVRMRVGFTPVLGSGRKDDPARRQRGSTAASVSERGADHARSRASRPAVRDDAVLEIRGLDVDYGLGDAAVHAVRDVHLTLRRGEVLGLAGESGSGKSTLAYGLTRLLPPPGVVAGGEVLYHPERGEPVDVLRMSPAQLRRFRWAETAIVFQGAMNSLNPVHKVSTQLMDVIKAHDPTSSRADRRDRARELLALVGIAEDRLDSYPHQLSGGMRQRVMIGMALALQPRVVIMDEPTTALDVVIQRQILRQLTELRERLGFSVLFITHDLSLLVEFSDRIAVMYGGRIVEQAASADLYRRALHPYSDGLLHSFPALRGPRRELTGIPGSPPDLRAMPTGCAFHPRCPRAFEPCAQRVPVLGMPRARQGEDRAGDDRAGNDRAGGDHAVACWLHPVQDTRF